MDSGPNVLLKDISCFLTELQTWNTRCAKILNDFLTWNLVRYYLGYAQFANNCSVLYIFENKAPNNECMSHSHGGDL